MKGHWKDIWKTDSGMCFPLVAGSVAKSSGIGITGENILEYISEKIMTIQLTFKNDNECEFTELMFDACHV